MIGLDIDITTIFYYEYARINTQKCPHSPFIRTPKKPFACLCAKIHLQKYAFSSKYVRIG